MKKFNEIDYKIMNRDEIYDYLYKDGYDNFNKNVSDLMNRINLFDYSQYQETNGEGIFYLAIVNNKIVGILLFEDYGKGKKWISYIDVDSKYRNKGIATNLIKLFKTNYKENDYVISTYLDDGDRYLKHKINQILKK